MPGTKEVVKEMEEASKTVLYTAGSHMPQFFAMGHGLDLPCAIQRKAAKAHSERVFTHLSSQIEEKRKEVVSTQEYKQTKEALSVVRTIEHNFISVELVWCVLFCSHHLHPTTYLPQLTSLLMFPIRLRMLWGSLGLGRKHWAA